MLLGVAAVGVAQKPGERPWRDRARTFVVLRIADALKLSDKEALQVSEVIRQADERRGELLKQRQTLEEQLRTALASKTPDDAELAKLVAQGNDIDQRLALVPETSFHDLQKILTVQQQAKLLLFRRELQGEVRRAMQSRGMRHRGGRSTATPR